MRWFLLTHFAVYFGFHAYALLHVHRAFGLSPVLLALSLLVCAGGVAGPVAALICDRRGLLALARVVAPAAFVWMGYVLLLVIALVCLDFLRLGAGVLYFAGFGAPADWLDRPEAAAVCLVVGRSGIVPDDGARASTIRRLPDLLNHRPAMFPNPVPFDLQLSGHTHGGQIFPFGFLVSRFYPLPDGLS